jgi:predicted O-linked N-acetylglucosamine transferase (SPINDLY family)
MVHGWAVKQTIHDFVSAASSSKISWQPSLTPSQMLLIHTDQAIVREALAQHHRHQHYLRAISAASLPSFTFSRAFPLAVSTATARPRLRLGYLSYSFGSGTRNGLLTEVLGRHFGGKIEVFAYALRPHDVSDDETKRKQIENHFEHWIDVSRDASFADISRRINDDAVQVLVDLCGLHSNGTNVYAVFADRPAPVQVACDL